MKGCLLKLSKGPPNAPFVEKTLKDWNILKILKTCNSNEKGLKWATLHCHEV